MLRKLIPAGAIVVLLTGAASAQIGNSGNTSGGVSLGVPSGGGERRLSNEERAREQEIEGKYRSTVDGMPDKKASNDPWGNVRSAPAKTTSTAKHKNQP
jgi:hypothetical protein